MKKWIALVLSLGFILSLTACHNMEKVSTYSFYGTHEYFTISNGEIVLSDKEEVFDGGDLQITNLGEFEQITSYSTTFYTFINGERGVILSNTVTDKTGGTVSIGADLGRVAGKTIFLGSDKSLEEVRKNLWFELKTSDLNNKTKAYQIQLTSRS